MSEQQCENSQTNPCPRTDTRIVTVSMGWMLLYRLWLCPEHTRPEWLSDTEARRAASRPPGTEAPA